MTEAEKMKAREGKILHFGIPEELHKKLRMQVLEEGTTIQHLVVRLLENYLAGQKK